MFSSKKKTLPLFFIFLTLAGLGFCFQNFTTVDFTAAPETRSSPPTALERAILKADKEQTVRQKKLGVDDRNIHKTYLKRERKPSAVGDLPFSEIDKHKRPPKRQRRQRSSSLKTNQQDLKTTNRPSAQ